MQSALKILFIDDHASLRDGMIFMLKNKNPSLLITGVGTVAETLETLRGEKDFRTIILDLSLDGDNSLESLSQIKEASLGSAILVYTMHNDDIHIQNALLLGVQGYVTKEASIEKLEKAVVAVSAGNVYYNTAAAKVMRSLLPQNKDRHVVNDEKSYLFDCYKALSKKEQEIFIHLAQGKDTCEIARLLGKSEKTVKNQRTSIFSKMMVADRHDLIENARLLGLVF